MIWVPGGEFTMGSDHDYPEERPAHRESVPGFWMDRTPVTNAEFAEFVAATGHVSTAERAPDPADYPDADPALLEAGSLVFTPPTHPVPLNDVRNWWSYIPGTTWRCPRGPGSSALPDHPVVHVSYYDAAAFAGWAGKALPTEAQWECAARGGGPPTRYAWGDDRIPGGVAQANTWIGEFPWRYNGPHAATLTSAVGTYPANGYGLVDMIGNVWEWTASPATASHRPRESSAADAHGPAACCAPAAPTPGLRELTIKGGSHLCSPDYCRRYRPAARQNHESGSSTSHLGFRCVRHAPRPPGTPDQVGE